MVWKKLFALIVLTASVTAFAENKVYGKLNQDYENTLKLLRTAGVNERIVSSDSAALQTLSKFKEISADYFAPAVLKDCKKNNGDAVFNITPRYNKIPFQLPNAKSYMTGPGNAVVPFSGEFIDSETDLSLPSRGGIGFSFIRTYSSYNKSDVGIGIGWRHNYDLWLSREKNRINLHLNSRDVVFQKQGGKWISGQGDFYALQEDKDGIIYILTPDLTRYKFEKAKKADSILRLAEVASRHGKSPCAVRSAMDIPMSTRRISAVAVPSSANIPSRSRPMHKLPMFPIAATRLPSLPRSFTGIPHTD